MTGVIYYGDTGWSVTLTFTGLVPTEEYTFVTSANRGNDGYDNRWSKYTISEADSYTYVQTTPNVIVKDGGASLSFCTGDNTSDGATAKWTGIDPGDDGSFTVTVKADGDEGDARYAYAFDVFVLQRE